MLFVSVLALSVSHSFDRFPLLSLRDIFPRRGGSLSSKGEPLAEPKTLPYCQGLSLWERWHGVSRDGEGKPASKRQIYEKALVFQGENLERREPVNSNYRAPVVPLSLLRLWAQPLCTIGFLRRIAARVTVGIRQSLLTVQPCRSGASNRSPLHPPCTTRRLSARRRKSFYLRQRICAFFKVD